MNPLQQLRNEGQAIWLDYIRRDLLTSGELERMVAEDGVTGVTSNPAIFQKAIGGSDLYDADIRALVADRPELSAVELYEELAVDEIRMAADVLRSVYDAEDGADGFVSLEVSPHLARDTEGTLAEARRLWSWVDRPNLMIKIPATPEGMPAIEEALAEGIHVNVTLMFSLADYEAVAGAFLRGVARASEPAQAASVASFFVSRVDSKIDGWLEEIGSDEALSLCGTIAVANSMLAYRRYRQLFHGEAFAALRARGARPQRVLWASTSTKNPAYRDVVYVEELIGAETVNTLPPATLEAFRDHGTVRRSLEEGLASADEPVRRLAAVGVDLDAATAELQREGVEKFAQPFDRLLATLEEKRSALAATAAAETAG
ncbi:MAG: transaldolase [Thermoanaerobaculia bacterium]